MKFSVLLPTRNRLELLKFAIETVRRQDYSDWEIIISDNFSEQDIAGYVQSLNDPRIKYYRTDSFVPVTDNWNNALEKSSGDYITMLGDDDCLMQGYFTALRDLIEKYDSPDFIYNSSFLYAYPQVMPGFPDGFLEPYGYAEFLKSTKEPFWLDKKKALDLVRHSMNFRVLLGYNMQFSIIARKFINSLQGKGKFFQSPYPDYYATNVMFLKGERILISPAPVVTIGISSKSFGFYFFNDSEQKGTTFLNNLPLMEMADRLHTVVLPGAANNSSWLYSLETIKTNYDAEYDLHVNYFRYRLLQTLTVFERYSINRDQAATALLKVWEALEVREKLAYGFILKIISLLPLSVRRKTFKRINAAVGTHPHYKPTKIEGKFRNILEVFENINPFDRNKKYAFKFKYSNAHFCKRTFVYFIEYLLLHKNYRPLKRIGNGRKV